MDATALGGLFSGGALLISAVSSVQITRNRRQRTRLDELEEDNERDAEALTAAEAWQYQARRYLATLFNYLADQGMTPPPPPPELGLMRSGGQMTTAPPPTRRPRHRLRARENRSTLDEPTAPPLDARAGRE